MASINNKIYVNLHKNTNTFHEWKVLVGVFDLIKYCFDDIRLLDITFGLALVAADSKTGLLIVKFLLTVALGTKDFSFRNLDTASTFAHGTWSESNVGIRLARAISFYKAHSFTFSTTYEHNDYLQNLLKIYLEVLPSKYKKDNKIKILLLILYHKIM